MMGSLPVRRIRPNRMQHRKGTHPKAHPTSWEPVASWYDTLLSDADTYQSKVILPNLLRLLPPKGARIIDIACGSGFFSKNYADQGADVLGVDISPSLIRKAREHETKNLHFGVAPASRIPQAKDDTFDGAVIVLALQNIKEMPETLAEAARVLAKGGTLVTVLNHPCFRIPQASAWGYDAERDIQYRRVERYGSSFSTRIDMTPGAKRERSKVHTVSFHRPLQDYFKALAKAGFSVTGLEEWISHKRSEPGPRAKTEDAARKEFPLFLAIVARKEP